MTDSVLILQGLTDEFISKIGTLGPIYNDWQLIHAGDQWSREVWFYEIGDYYLDVSESHSGRAGYTWSLVKWDMPHQGVIVFSEDLDVPVFDTVEKAKINAKAYLDFWVSIGKPNQVKR